MGAGPFLVIFIFLGSVRRPLLKLVLETEWDFLQSNNKNSETAMSTTMAFVGSILKQKKSEYNEKLCKKRRYHSSVFKYRFFQRSLVYFDSFILIIVIENYDLTLVGFLYELLMVFCWRKCKILCNTNSAYNHIALLINLFVTIISKRNIK